MAQAAAKRVVFNDTGQGVLRSPSDAGNTDVGQAQENQALHISDLCTKGKATAFSA